MIARGVCNGKSYGSGLTFCCAGCFNASEKVLPCIFQTHSSFVAGISLKAGKAPKIQTIKSRFPCIICIHYLYLQLYASSRKIFGAGLIKFWRGHNSSIIFQNF